MKIGTENACVCDVCTHVIKGDGPLIIVKSGIWTYHICSVECYNQIKPQLKSPMKTTT